MTVYVDDLQTYPVRGAAARFGNCWCHMGCDGDVAELHTLAERIGLKRIWFQDKPHYPHYDLLPSKRAAAVRAGAVCVSSRKWIEKCRKEK